MDNITLSSEQFAELLDRVAPKPSGLVEYKPEDNKLCESLALEVLQCISRNGFYPTDYAKDCLKYCELRKAIRDICREYV
jgi:hypothetical protein